MNGKEIFVLLSVLLASILLINLIFFSFRKINELTFWTIIAVSWIGYLLLRRTARKI